MILRFLFYAFLLYLAFRFVFGFIIPLVRTTRKVRRGFREMREKMEQQQFHQYQEPQPETRRPGPDKPGEYIDFEEVKE